MVANFIHFSSLATFSLEKRIFLHQQLNDILHLWARSSGQGSFYLSINDGTPNFQFGLHLDLMDRDSSVPEPPHQPKQQVPQRCDGSAPDPPTQPSKHLHHQQQVPRRRGHGQQARNRE